MGAASSNISTATPPPPPYNKSKDPAVLSQTTNQLPLKNTNEALLAPSNVINALKLHPVVGIYNSGFSNMHLALSADANQSMFYAEYHSYWSSKPSIQLFFGASPNDPLVSAANFGSGWSTTVANVTLNSTAPTQEPSVIDLKREGIIRISYMFTIMVPASGQIERFEWRRSRSAEIKRLGGRSNGLELVRCATEEVLAVYAVVASPKKIGKISWISRTELGEKPELMGFMSLLCILLSHSSKSSSGGSGGGGQSGGGGCGGC